MIAKQIREIYNIANEISGKRLEILSKAFSTFSNARAAQASTSLAYYAIFSLFPLLLVLIAGGSYFLDDQQAFQSVIQIFQSAIPNSSALIEENLQQVLQARGTVGIIGLLTLLWSASGFFSGLAHNINLAWSNAPKRNLFINRLLGLGMVTSLIGLLFLLLALEGIASFIPFLDVDNASSSRLGMWSLLSNIISWLTGFLLFIVLYHWIPAANVSWNGTFAAALTASIGWKLTTAGFSWYLHLGFGQYQLVYGSLGAIMAFLLVTYFLSMITLFGAHLSAAIDFWNKKH